MEDIKKLLFSCIMGFLAMITKQYTVIFTLVCIGIVLDCITGLIKSKVTGIAITSKKGVRGFWKKTGFIFSFAFGIFLDSFIPMLLDIINIELPFSSPFGLIIGVYITLNESISISENLIAINPESVPKWIVSLLKNTAGNINKNKSNDKEE